MEGSQTHDQKTLYGTPRQRERGLFRAPMLRHVVYSHDVRRHARLSNPRIFALHVRDNRQPKNHRIT